MSEETIKLHNLLERVKDKETFILFIEALADERELAQEIERANPKSYCIDGALGWKNGDISSFLSAGLYCFEDEAFNHPEQEPSWQMFADFFYCGKIMD